MDKRTLRRPRSARPYDRQNQSIFGKVCSTVKGLFNPSWLTGVTQWIGNSASTADEIEEETVREDNDIACPSASHGSKRLRLRLDEQPSPSIQNSGTQTWPEQPPQNLFNSISHVQSSSTQSPLIENKETIAVLNGDDHSENSEGSASTSGCSSLVSSHKEINRLGESPFVSLLELKNNRKRKLSNSKPGLNDLNNSGNLWSSNFSPKFQRRLPTISHSNQPSFNLSTFVGPSKLNDSVEKKALSPFYEGRTTFGGAAASRRMPPTVTPYQIDKSRNKIRIRDTSSDDNLEGMSSAAKRILLTLEKMSTPVADAKKVPNTDTSPIDVSLYMTPPKSHRNSQFTPSIAGKGPPIANINTIAKLATLKNYGASRLRNTLLSPMSIDSKIEKKSDLPTNMFGSVFSNSMESEMPSNNNLPKDNISIPSCESRYEKKTDSLPKPFVFSNPIEHELPINNYLPKENTTLSPALDSKFKKISDLQPKSFVFSSPIEPELPNNNVLHKENITLQAISTASTPIMNSPLSTWAKNSNPKTSPILNRDSPQVTKETTSALKFKSSEETKSNPLVSSTVPASSTGFSFSSPASHFNFGSSSPAAVFGFGAPKSDSQKVTPAKPLTFGSASSSSTWECDACWVRNPETDSKCKACETPRSKKEKAAETSTTKNNSSLSDAFATWECTSCWVRNPMKEKKCMACETLHPNADKSPGFSFKDLEKAKTSSSVFLSTTTIPSLSSSTPGLFGNKVIQSDAENTTVPTFSFCSGPEKNKASTTPSESIAAPSSEQKSSSLVPGSTGLSAFEVSKTDVSAVTTSSFTFGSATSASTTSSALQPEKTTFKFGVPATASNAPTVTTSSSFSFGKIDSSKETSSATPQNPVFPIASVASDNVLDTKNDSFKQVATSKISQESGFTFASPTNVSSSNSETVVTTSQNTAQAPASSAITSVFGNKPVQSSDEAEKPTISGFSFGVPPTSGAFQFGASTNKTLPVSSSGSGTVTSNSSASTWECSACWVRNPQSRTTCAACETPHAKKDMNTPKSKDVEEVKSTSAESTVVSTSSTGFSFGNTTSTSAVFTFGAQKTESENGGIKPFSFGSAASTWECNTCLIRNPEAEAKCKACEAPRSSKDTSSKGGFTFKNEGIGSLATSQSTSSGLNINTMAPASSGGFVFGGVKTENQSTAPTPFVFGSGLEKSQTTSSVSSSLSQTIAPGLNVSTSATAPSGGFVFGGPKVEAQNPTPAPFSFGTGLDKNQNKPSVSSSVSQSGNVASNISTSTAVSTGGFVFGAPKSEALTSTATPFAFGSGTPSSNASAFSAFPSSQSPAVTFKFGAQASGSSTVPSSMANNFSFTKSEPSSQIPSSAPQNSVPLFGSTNSNFVFGSKSDTTLQIPSTVSQAPALAFGSSTNFTFGGKSENSATSQNAAVPAFRSSQSMQSAWNPPAPALSFGGTDKPISSGFNFGAAASGVFQFGAANNNTSNNVDKKRTAAASGFSFIPPAAPETNNSFSTGGFNVTTPQSFNFGATSTTGTFQFAASAAPKPSPQSQAATRKIRKAHRRVLRKE